MQKKDNDEMGDDESGVSGSRIETREENARERDVYSLVEMPPSFVNSVLEEKVKAVPTRHAGRYG